MLKNKNKQILHAVRQVNHVTGNAQKYEEVNPWQKHSAMKIRPIEGTKGSLTLYVLTFIKEKKN